MCYFAGAQQLLQLDSVVCLFVCFSYLSRFFSIKAVLCLSLRACDLVGTQQLLQLDSVVKQKAFPPPAANARQRGRNKQEVMVARSSLSVGEIINPCFKIPGLSRKNQSLEKQNAIFPTPSAVFFGILSAGVGYRKRKTFGPLSKRPKWIALPTLSMLMLIRVANVVVSRHLHLGYLWWSQDWYFELILCN